MNKKKPVSFHIIDEFKSTVKSLGINEKGVFVIFKNGDKMAIYPDGLATYEGTIKGASTNGKLNVYHRFV